MKNGNVPVTVYSKEVEEILARKPLWIVRYGIPLIAFAFALFLFICYFIPYPEKTSFKATSELTFLPESINQNSRFCGITVTSEYSDLFKQGKWIDIFSGSTRKSDHSIRVQVSGLITDPVSGSTVAVIRMNPSEYLQLFGDQLNTEIRLVTKSSNLLSRIFSPVIALFKDPLSPNDTRTYDR